MTEDEVIERMKALGYATGFLDSDSMVTLMPRSSYIRLLWMRPDGAHARVIEKAPGDYKIAFYEPSRVEDDLP